MAHLQRRALEINGIASLEQQSKYTEKEVLNFNGMGKSTIPKLKEALTKADLSFNK
ncbi:MAG: hypothetical protein IPH11_02940 [Ignavibacteriales bacterium]|nr:hypothetical protein [Ignavibacteriales bacterium]